MLEVAPIMHSLDLAVILVYLAGITWFGARFRSGQKNLRDYFLGGRTAPWWAISLSIVSAETSTLTIVGTPALAFNGNLGFLQIVVGYLLARIVISILFLPHYFKGEMFTAYELMRRRFGERIRKLTASIFLVTRALAEGVRVFAISLVISIVLGTGEIQSIVLIVVLTLFYTFEGGMTAVIWTDVVQMSLYVLGALLSFLVILGKIPGGWAHVALVAGAAHKFTIFDFRFAPTMEFFSHTYTFWAGVAGGCFLTTSSHGTDQLMVQRLLSARDERQSRTALMASWVVILIQFTLFLLIGVLLYVYYGDMHLPQPAPDRTDRIYPAFIWNNLPPGLAGLLIAAILAAAMANLSAALNSLSSTTVVDFLQARRREMTEKRSMQLAKLGTVIWGAVLLAIAIGAGHMSKSVLEAGLKIASIPSGMLLGVFLLGILTRKPREGAAMVGVACGLATILFVCFRTPIAFTWYVLIGTTVTFGTALLASLFEPAMAPTKEE
ncbi:SSS sodium solute transporter superfamily [Candidatus Sulfopaludibacter sp. SbA3]|nr:SSS sodium solute transporter superfamily [Candidatus Sulfopaludibacter sp. SbA3]